jgi:hypothetical protein
VSLSRFFPQRRNHLRRKLRIKQLTFGQGNCRLAGREVPAVEVFRPDKRNGFLPRSGKLQCLGLDTQPLAG